MQAGIDREWARPYNPHPDPHEPHGSHIGPYACLNIRNPTPGFHTAYAHRDDPGGFTNMQMMGFRPVTLDDPHGPRLAADLPMQFGAPQDNLVGMGKLVLMQIPLDRYAEIREEEDRIRAEKNRGPTAAYLDRGAGFEREQGRRPRTGAVYALPDHGETGYNFGEEEF